MGNNWIRRVLALVLALMLAVPFFAMADELVEKSAAAKDGSSFYIAANSTVTMNVGQQIAVDPQGRTVKSVKSSRKKSASISMSGVVTALAEGTSKLTITYTNRTRFVFKVKVVDPNKPSSVYFAEGAAINLYAGQSKALTPQLSPSTAVTTYTWKTSRSKIVKVSGGVITGVAKGTAKITVTTANKKKATITVRVLANKVDNLNPAPTAADIAAIGRNWTVRLKSVEILGGGKVAVEFYLLNGLGTSKQIQNLYVDLWMGSIPLVRGTINKVSVNCGRSRSKVFKVTFKGSQVLTSSLVLPQASNQRFRFKGLNGVLRYRY